MRVRVVSPSAAGSLSSGTHGLAAGLADQLAEACDGRLGEITWFKADWQRGGAATGTARFRLADSEDSSETASETLRPDSSMRP